MLTVEDFGRIRRAYRDGESIRSIAQRLGHSRRKVREALREPEPRGYTLQAPRAAPKLGPFVDQIEEILALDEQAPPKQRHTGAQLFRRLQESGYQGGYDQVRRYLSRRGVRHRETFIPLEHGPGQRAEADFGALTVDFPQGRRVLPVLLVTWAYSYCPFVLAVPTARTEAVLHGLVRAWEFFDCVPRELWWDNPTTVAVEILSGRERRLNARYAALASHYNFEPLFCMPARGNEKPRVENRVKTLERQWGTPVPRMEHLDHLNDYLRNCCLADRQRAVAGQTETIGARFEQDRAAALALPVHAFDPCLAEERQADKYQTVKFDHNRYSVPHQWAFRPVTVKAYVDHLEIVAGGQVVARHVRSYERGGQILDPLHYLVTLGRKPACLDKAPVYRDWRLPAEFLELRKLLEHAHGPAQGPRQFVRVLQLLRQHPLERVSRAVAECLARDHPPLHANHVLERVARLAVQASGTETEPLGDARVPAVAVPRPDLKRFDQLLLEFTVPPSPAGEPPHEDHAGCECEPVA